MLRGMRTRLVILLAAACALPACDKGNSKAEPDAAPVASATAAPSAAPRPRPDDLDVPALRQPLKCATAAKNPRPVCQVLDEFEKADAWNLETIRGTDARYFGQATIVEKGQPRMGWYFLVVKKVPTNEVAAGDLPIKVAIRELEPTLGAENAQAPRLLRALEHDDAVSKGNSTIQYVKSYAPSNWDGANVTAGPSTIMHSQGGMFVRENKKRQLHIIQLAAVGVGGANSGDGIYATLHPVSW